VSSKLRRHPPRTANRLAVRRRVATLLAIAAVSVVASAAGACSGGMPSPTRELNAGQAVMDLGSLVSELREENAIMQAQIDSLRGALAYQDTIVQQLAAGAGVQMRASAFPTH
jgi:hypothetical protein